jgi:hypothetical protein
VHGQSPPLPLRRRRRCRSAATAAAAAARRGAPRRASAIPHAAHAGALTRQKLRKLRALSPFIVDAPCCRSKSTRRRAHIAQRGRTLFFAAPKSASKLKD